MAERDRTASLMSPSRLASMNPKAGVTPAAWLNQMPADAGHLHVRRIAELGEVLQEQATSPELAAVASQLRQLADALQQLDFSRSPRGPGADPAPVVGLNVKDWHGRVSVLAGSAKAAKGRLLVVQGPLGTHEELEASVAEAVAVCEQLLAQEQVLARSLVSLSTQHAPH